MRQLFGTDGIRGVAGDAPLDRRTIFAVGIALAQSLQRSFPSPAILLGADTRESGNWISGVISAGLERGGATVKNAGIITTPAVAYLTRQHAFAAGIVISASHNPWQDNGIKVFASDGYKLPDTVELAIEDSMFALLGDPQFVFDASPSAPTVEEKYRFEYEHFLRAAVPGLRLDEKSVVIDCANGAASAIAPELFREFGGTLHLTHTQPNGRNINAECGALHPEVVAKETKELGADFGVTFDGDADRVLFADAFGNVINGDALLLLAARDLKSRGELHNNTVVATTMSNMGLEAAPAPGRHSHAARARRRQVCAAADGGKKTRRSAASSPATFFFQPGQPRATVC